MISVSSAHHASYLYSLAVFSSDILLVCYLVSIFHLCDRFREFYRGSFCHGAICDVLQLGSIDS